MTILTWAVRLLIFAILVLFAVRNTDPVSLRFFADQVWQAPLVIVLLTFFAAGTLLGVLSLLGVIYRQRREISRLKRLVAAPVSRPEPPPAV